MIGKTDEVKRSYSIQKQLRTFYPVLKDQSFTVFVLAENAADICEKQLRSIFEQTYCQYKVLYVDNGSTDQTAEKVRTCSISENHENKLILIHYEHKKPRLEAIYKAIHNIDPHEIVLFLDGHDWLAHENVLSHLNSAYANPDVWLTYSRGIHYPDYQKIGGRACSDLFLAEKQCRKKGLPTASSLISFPAAYFKRIHLKDLLLDSHFVDEVEAFLYPLFEMGPQHVLFTDEVMLVKNDTKPSDTGKDHLHHIMAVGSHLSLLRPYANLSGLNPHLNHSSHRSEKGDVLIFSDDSPLHLYACLESLHAQVKGINDVHVIYQSHDREIGRAYLNVKNEFPNVQFMEVCDYPESDFGSLLQKTLANRRHGMSYLLITDDLHVFDQTLDLHTCVEALEKVHADHLFLLFEQNGINSSSDQALYMGNDIYALQIDKEGLQQSPYMCVYRKAAIENTTRTLQINTPTAFKRYGKKYISPHIVTLFYANKKALPMRPDQEATLSQKKEWGHKLLEGYKIDLLSLCSEKENIQNDNYPLVTRENRKESS